MKKNLGSTTFLLLGEMLSHLLLSVSKRYVSLRKFQNRVLLCMVLYENYNSNKARKRLTLLGQKEKKKKVSSFYLRFYGRNHVIMECCIAAIEHVSIYQPKNVAETTVN